MSKPHSGSSRVAACKLSLYFVTEFLSRFFARSVSQRPRAVQLPNLLSQHQHNLRKRMLNPRAVQCRARKRSDCLRRTTINTSRISPFTSVACYAKTEVHSLSFSRNAVFVQTTHRDCTVRRLCDTGVLRVSRAASRYAAHRQH